MGYADKAIVDFVLVDHPQTCPLEIFKHGLDIYISSVTLTVLSCLVICQCRAAVAQH